MIAPSLKTHGYGAMWTEELLDAAHEPGAYVVNENRRLLPI